MIKLIMQSPAAPSCPRLFIGPDLFCRTLFLNALKLCSSCSVRKQVSHPFEITSKKVTFILIFIFLNSKEEHKTGLNGSRYSHSAVSS